MPSSSVFSYFPNYGDFEIIARFIYNFFIFDFFQEIAMEFIMQANSPCSRKAFTLVEMLVVITIIHFPGGKSWTPSL
jgi:hypothetical protein